MQDRGQWTEDYARWRRRNSIAPDAKVPSLLRLPLQLCDVQQGMFNRLQQWPLFTLAMAHQVLLFVEGQSEPYAGSCIAPDRALQA